MPNIQIVIAKIKTTDKQVHITDSNGNIYSGFIKSKDGTPTGLATLHEGDEIEADITSNKVGDRTYLNIGAFHVTAKNDTGGNGESPAKPPTPAFELAPSNRRNNALTAALALITTGKMQANSLNELLALASKIDHWMETGKYEAPIQPKG